MEDDMVSVKRLERRSEILSAIMKPKTFSGSLKKRVNWVLSLIYPNYDVSMS